MKYIVPKERRLLIYSVYKNQIINIDQKQKLIGLFKVDVTELEECKNKCLSEMDNETNLHSIIYVQQDGRIESEVNVVRPKYEFHVDYNN
jgi:hypothetical protein